MIFKNRILPMLPMMIATACSGPDSVDITERATVEAYLRPGKPVEVTISKEGLFQNATIDTIEFIDGLTVKIKEGDNSYALQSVGDGKYISDERVTVASGKVYALDFEYGDKALSASTYVPSSPEGFELSAYEIEINRPSPGSNP